MLSAKAKTPVKIGDKPKVVATLNKKPSLAPARRKPF
jgi:hypothetical protein